MHSQFGQAEWILDLMTTCGVKITVFEAGAQNPVKYQILSVLLKLVGIPYWLSRTHHCEDWRRLQNDRIEIFNELIPYTSNSLDSILSKTVGNRDLDVLFLDIDGSEYHQIKNMCMYRPSIICVEYDNSYPLSIEYIPNMMFHSVPSGQASSKATFKLMQQKNYIYIKSFFLDHIFVSKEFFEKNLSIFNSQPTGINLFINEAPHHLYNITSVVLNQQDGSGGSGVSFYTEKVMNLVKTDQFRDASTYYHMLSNYFHSLTSLVLERRGEDYHNQFKDSLSLFDEAFSKLLFTA